MTANSNSTVAVLGTRVGRQLRSCSRAQAVVSNVAIPVCAPASGEITQRGACRVTSGFLWCYMLDGGFQEDIYES